MLHIYWKIGFVFYICILISIFIYIFYHWRIQHYSKINGTFEPFTKIKHVAYINLDSRYDRQKQVEDEFEKMGWDAQRIAAVPWKYGHIGCTKSHIQTLEYAKAKNWPHVLICEDDLVFTKPADQIHTLLDGFFKQHKQWDVVFLGCGINVKEDLQPNCVQVINGGLSHCYLVSQRYYDTLLNNFKEGLELLEKHYPDDSYHLDVYWGKLQKQDRWLCVQPIVAAQRQSYSDNFNQTVSRLV